MGLNLDVDNRYLFGRRGCRSHPVAVAAAGTVVAASACARAESLGRRGEVPDTGVDERVASLELRRAGLEVGEIARLPDKDAAAGTVLAQDPPRTRKALSNRA